MAREPVTGGALASQRTISRVENGVGGAGLYRLGRELAVRAPRSGSCWKNTYAAAVSSTRRWVAQNWQELVRTP